MNDQSNQLAFCIGAAIAAGTVTACWVVRRESNQIREAVAAAAERRRLRALHEHDQLTAEIDELTRVKYAEGYADGVTRREER